LIKFPSFQYWGTAAILPMFALFSQNSFSAVIAEPAEVTFVSPNQSFTIHLTSGGTPIPAADIQGWRLLASDHDYQHMIVVEKMDGAVIVSPSKAVELGSYDLSIETSKGSVVIRVFMPLSDVPDIVEKLTALTGESEARVKEKLGLSSTTGRSEITFTLPPVYYEGQTLEQTLAKEPEAGHTSTWFVNGEAVDGDDENNAFAYTFERPGEYVLTYVETVTENGTVVLVAHGRASTSVVAFPSIAAEATAGTPITFSAPAGFQKSVWSVDGKEISTGDSLTYTFAASGSAMVECLSTDPVKGPSGSFLRVRFRTNVNPA